MRNAVSGNMLLDSRIIDVVQQALASIVPSFTLHHQALFWYQIRSICYCQPAACWRTVRTSSRVLRNSLRFGLRRAPTVTMICVTSAGESLNKCGTQTADMSFVHKCMHSCGQKYTYICAVHFRPEKK